MLAGPRRPTLLVESKSAEWTAGARVMALLEGGGYAEYVACAPGSLMEVPEKMSDEDAGCITEVWLTAFQLLFKVAKMTEGCDKSPHIYPAVVVPDIGTGHSSIRCTAGLCIGDFLIPYSGRTARSET